VPPKRYDASNKEVIQVIRLNPCGDQSRRGAHVVGSLHSATGSMLVIAQVRRSGGVCTIDRFEN
jgi:hypothetical protein